MKELKKKAVIYVQVNNNLQEAEKQLEELWTFAESKGFAVTNAYYEVTNGLAHVHNRTIWHLMEDAKKHSFDAVIIKDISRISRNAKDALSLLNELEANGLRLVTKQDVIAPLSLEVKL
jgi:DNA invertase Pin-like site-specific DNA recombinase